MIPYGRQEITQADIDAVVETLRSDFLTQGPQVPAFEQAVADYCRATHAVAVNSGTSALHLACKALDLKPGGLLWTTPITFVASANCALYCGADVDFVDIDPATGNMSIEALQTKLEQADKAGRLPNIVVPVHFAGLPCDMASIAALSSRYGFRVIEDACHAIGARYSTGPVGNCRFSDITIFSFHPVKLVTTAEGGMAVTNDSRLADRMRLLRSHGITRNPDQMSRTPDGPWYYEQIDLGFNYRLTDIQAALGQSQLHRLDDYILRRHELAMRYDQHIAHLPLRPLGRQIDGRSALHLYVVRLDTTESPLSRGQLFDRLREAGIGVNVHYIPVHTQPHYQEMGFQPGDFPKAERYYREALTLPLSPGLTEAQQDTVIQALTRALS
ncbi:MAG: UDP-4-amino-4,6-dideoxy-N-acetyl-beta-L-altrosamine transaminase [Candidatus Zixiibacteriota bacterium]|nr:MAG: UDP-4-amino-4,6-dideoxy-N-acetyl-beta-L-altrosamine transaminase [candidate division Zixibacteria bacterium]